MISDDDIRRELVIHGVDLRSPEGIEALAAARAYRRKQQARPSPEAGASLRDTIRTALHDEWWRSIREKIEDSPEGHVDRLTDVVTLAVEPAIRKAYGRGRDDEAAGDPIPPEMGA